MVNQLCTDCVGARTLSLCMGVIGDVVLDSVIAVTFHFIIILNSVVAAHV
ncbi:MAG: hypothetical protein R2867_32125 [Caldilineaceae bacterium]